MAKTYVLEREQSVPRPLDETFAFFADPRNLQAITPPWLRFRILEAPAEIDTGSLLRYRIRLIGWPIEWRTEIRDWSPPHRFVDAQLEGPYPLWEHTHTLEADGEGTVVRDRVLYQVPGGPLAPVVNAVVGIWLRRIFDFRARALARSLG